MAIIRIQRKSEYNNKARDFKIFIDGEQAGTIANGEQKEFTTSAGPHTITAKIDWCSSPEVFVNVEDHQPVSLQVGGFRNGDTILRFIFLIAALHFIVYLAFNFEYVILLIFPAALPLVYYITFGRKEYLTLEEIL